MISIVSIVKKSFVSDHLICLCLLTWPVMCILCSEYEVGRVVFDRLNPTYEVSWIIWGSQIFWQFDMEFIAIIGFVICESGIAYHKTTCIWGIWINQPEWEDVIHTWGRSGIRDVTCDVMGGSTMDGTTFWLCFVSTINGTYLLHCCVGRHIKLAYVCIVSVQTLW